MKDEQPRVLLVDDERSNLKILSELLRDEADLILAKSGSQALEKARTLRPDLILLDVMMPDMDGFQVIKELKNYPQNRNTPVIFITAMSDVEDEARGFALGACDYIHKPFHAGLVKARVRTHLKLEKQRKMLEELAHIDPLTEIANRRKYESVFELEWHRAFAACTELSVVLVDIDCFKEYNDHYGHSAGDAALEAVAHTLRRNLRYGQDFIARYGGEEFVIVLPDTSQEDAVKLMRRCCNAVTSLRLRHEHSKAGSWLSISVGGQTLVPQQEGREVRDRALALSDRMLYKAKSNGRNCVVWQDEAEPLALS